MADDVIGKLQFIVEVDNEKGITSIKKFDSSVKDATKTTQDAEKNQKKAFEGINLKATAVASAVGVAVVKMAKEVMKATNTMQDGRKIIVQATGATGEALDSLMNSAKNVFATVDESFDEVSTALGEINTRFGYTGQILEDTTRMFLDFAEATGQDVKNAVKTSAQVINQWNLSAEEMPLLLDKLTVAGQVTGVAVSQLSANLTDSAGTLQAMGYELDEAISLMMTFEKQGIDSSAVLMGMKQSFAQSAKAGTDARKDWDNLIKSIANATDEATANEKAINAFGSRVASTLVTALRSGKISTDEFTDALNNAQGALSATDEAGKTTADRIQELKNQWTLALAEIGEAFAPLLESLLPLLADGLSAVATLVKEIIDTITGANLADEIENIQVPPAVLHSHEELRKSSVRNAESLKEEQKQLRAMNKEAQEATKTLDDAVNATDSLTDSNNNASDSTETLSLEEKQLADEREKNSEKYVALLEEQREQNQKNLADELESQGLIQQSYKIRLDLVKKEHDKEREELEKLIKANKATSTDLVNLEKTHAEKIRRINEEMNKAIIKDSARRAEASKKHMEDMVNTIVDMSMSMLNQLTEIYNQQATNYKAQLDKMKKAREADVESYKKATDEKLLALQNANQKGTLSDEEYARKKQKVENDLADYTKKRTEKDLASEKALKKHINEVEEKAFKARKATAIAQALIDGASAIMKAFASLGPIAGAVYAGIQAGLTAVQVSAIAQQQYVPSYLVGSDNIYENQLAYLHKGEAVLPPADAKRFREFGGMYGIEKATSVPLSVSSANGINSVNVNSNLSAVIEVDGVQLGVAVLKNIDNASQFILR